MAKAKVRTTVAVAVSQSSRRPRLPYGRSTRLRADQATSVSIGRSYRDLIVATAERTGWLQRDIVEWAIDSIDLAKVPKRPAVRSLKEYLRSRR